MFTTHTPSPMPTAPAVVLAAQLYLDKLQTTIAAEAQVVLTALSTMKFGQYAVDGPMLTGAWGGDTDFADVL